MIKPISITEVSRHLSDYLNRVAYKGEHFVLLRGKKAVAELKPVPKGRVLKELPDLINSLPHLSKKDAQDFQKDIAKVKSELDKRKIRDPWAY